jgi:hypothetical protein
MTSPEAIDTQAMAQAFRGYMSANNVDAEKIDTTVKRVLDASTVYPANASIVTALRVEIQVTITEIPPDGVFTGWASGIGTSVGSSSLIGYVQTDDYNTMCAKTTNFNVLPLGPSMAIGFWDDNGNWTGAYSGVEISTLLGAFSGSGSWSC